MGICVVLFDLDGTLLPMDQEEFTRGYFQLLANKMALHGYRPKQLIDAVWSGTGAMIKNDGSRTNEEAFWKSFQKVYGEKVLADKPLFEEFYQKDFEGAKAFCPCNPMVRETVLQIKRMGYRIALATNPIFPAVATESRIRWAGLEPEDFELYTTYENTSCCKPNPAYYGDVAARLGADPENCLMVGNSVEEDMIAETVGMKTFLLTDCLLNEKDRDISRYAHGGFDQLLHFLTK